jgi:ABC-type phosphate transport system substrate-binding protein
MRTARGFTAVAIAAAAAFTGTALMGAGPAVAAARTTSYVTINGSGSSWAEVAIDRWSQTVEDHGLTVNFNPDGSFAGRVDYIEGQDDFAASDVAFSNGQDKLAGTRRQTVKYGYSYLPDVAGGTAFPYHLTVGGHRVTNLRLSPQTLVGIFTGKITNWDNPAITRDNGRRLPNLAITPIVHAEGSGDTFFFTRWMATQFPARWNAFCAEITHGRIKPPCGPTEFYPTSGWGNVKAQNGSTNVVSYISSRFGDGAIGYDEFAYAVNAHLPVAALRNPDGKYVLPTARNVTTALTRAQINEDPASPNYLQQNLDNVYTFRNPHSYPLSSYSYLIVPRSGSKPAPPNFSKAKGRSLSAFADYLLCRGQRDVAPLGYAPLPANLVKGGLAVVGHIPGHAAAPTWAHCP